jgi:hypothetical protein
MMLKTRGEGSSLTWVHVLHRLVVGRVANAGAIAEALAVALLGSWAVQRGAAQKLLAFFCKVSRAL